MSLMPDFRELPCIFPVNRECWLRQGVSGLRTPPINHRLSRYLQAASESGPHFRGLSLEGPVCITIKIVVSSETMNLRRREADIAIRRLRPDRLEIICEKIKKCALPTLRFGCVS